MTLQITVKCFARFARKWTPALSDKHCEAIAVTIIMNTPINPKRQKGIGSSLLVQNDVKSLYL